MNAAADTRDPKTYYAANGYHVFRQLIPHALIDDLLDEYRKTLLPSGDHFLRQSTDLWEKNSLTAEGYCRQSFQDVHDFSGRYAQFSTLAKRIFCSQPVRQALRKITGSDHHNLMQSMFFDMNTATGAHQDYWYLDSVPGGHLAAGWFALEDIREDAGRFYVLPGSHRLELELDRNALVSSAIFQEKVAAYVRAHQDRIAAPALGKGDVLFWNSRTIHGSLPTRDAMLSRKSLTAHFLPSEYGFGNAKTRIAVEYGEFDAMRYRLDRRRYTAAARLRAHAFKVLDAHPWLLRAVAGLRGLAGAVARAARGDRT